MVLVPAALVVTLRRMAPPYEELHAWRECHELALAVYCATKSFPTEEQYGLTSQTRRAAFSAAVNIVEGSARRSRKEFRRFLDIALSSLAEVGYALRFCREAGPFAGLHELNAVRVEYFRAAFNGFGGKRVLDVGCGGGILAEALATEGARVTGIDPSERSLSAARDHAQRAGLAIDYRPGTAEDVKTAGLDGTYDLVFAVDVLEHVDDLDRTLAGVAAVLAPGGGLGFLTHNRTIAGFLQVVWNEEYVQHTMPEGFHEFQRFITPAELTEKLARNDMVVQEMKGIARAGDGTGRRLLTDDLSITYLGWALRTR